MHCMVVIVSLQMHVTHASMAGFVWAGHKTHQRSTRPVRSILEDGDMERKNEEEVRANHTDTMLVW